MDPLICQETTEVCEEVLKKNKIRFLEKTDEFVMTASADQLITELRRKFFS